MRERCENCRFAHEEYGHQCMVWRCRRDAPYAAQKDGWSDAYRRGVWPEIQRDDWCGEWQKIGTSKPQPEPETAQERMWKWFWR